jgi:hypothetical protein
MKIHALFVVIFSVFMFAACEDEETIKSEISSVSLDGRLSGEIEDFVSGDIDSIQVSGPSSSILGSCNVSSTGSFSINLTTPTNAPVLVKSYLLDEFEGKVSNENASISYASLLCFKDGQIIGWLVKCNFPVDQTSNNIGISSDGYGKGAIYGKVGSAYSDILFCSDPVTIEGNAVSEISLPVTPGYYMDRMIIGYDISFKQGWNEVVIKYTKYSTSKPAYVFNVGYSNLITNDLKWRIFKLENL